MAITVATFKVTNRDLKFPVRKRRNFRVEDDKGNVEVWFAIDVEDLDFDDQAFLDNVLIPKFKRNVREKEIREAEEAKSSLPTLKRAVEDEERAIEDAIDAELAVEVTRGG